MKSIRSELEFLSIDVEYKQQLIQQEDKEFLKMMNEILDENPELKKLYMDKEDKRKEEVIIDKINKAQEEEEKHKEEEKVEDVEEPNPDEETEPDPEPEEPTPISEKDKKLKKLYRKIVKLTHPDKIEDVKLNTLYLQATEYYNNSNIYGIYKVCDELDIEYDIEESELIFMSQEINSIKNRIGQIEGTFTWKWTTAPNTDIKKQVVIEFINMKLKQ